MNNKRIFGFEQFINENKETAEKLYLNTSLIKDEDFNKILEITGGDNWTKLVCQFFLQYGWKGEYYFPSAQKVIITPAEFYELLKEYKKTVFPIEGFDYLKVEDIKFLCECLVYRKEILKLFNELPSIAFRNMKSDITKSLPSKNVESRYRPTDFKDYYSQLRRFIEHYRQYVLPKEKEFQQTFNKKLFKSGSDIISIRSFLSRKENLLRGVELTKDKIKEICRHKDLEIVYNQENIMVVEVSSHKGMVAIGCNSLWCFSYDNEEGEGWWEKYSKGSTVPGSEEDDEIVYVIIDFSKPSDSEKFMFVVPNPSISRGSDYEENLMAFNMMNRSIGSTTYGKFDNLFTYLFGEDWQDWIGELFTFRKRR